MNDPAESADPTGPLALVMGGGGARAAYQVGFLRALARTRPDLEIPILTGVSAGAINAVHLAAHPGNFQEAVEDLAKLWEGITMDQVFRIDTRSLAVNAIRWGVQLVSGGLTGAPRIRSLVDTSPLEQFLAGALPEEDGRIPGIDEKLRSGRLQALAVSASSYSTGQSITWVQGTGVEGWSRPQRLARITEITHRHVMASSAIPLFFPAVQIGNEWYGDGGVRLSAPLSPALRLGAHRVLVISTRFERLPGEAEEPLISGYPPPAQVIGSLMNAIFLDLLDQDAGRVEALNAALRPLPSEERGGMRVVQLRILKPSQDLGKLARDFEITLPKAFRFLLRGLGTRQTKSPDILSFLLFDPDYIRLMMEMGERDAEARMGEIEGILTPDAESPPSPSLPSPSSELQIIPEG